MAAQHHLLLFLTACLFSSCGFQPAIDKNGNITPRKPNPLILSFSNSQFERMKKKYATSSDPRYTEPVNRVVKKLIPVIDLPRAEWEFVIFQDDTPNAFALSNGKVGINTGLFKITTNDALLAAVLGHEIAHATANHSEQRVYHIIGTIALGAILWKAADEHHLDNSAYTVSGYALSAALLDTLPLTRRQEYESDKMGAVYMAKAGYDPRASIKLWKKIEANHQARNKKNHSAFLRTHPQNTSRIKALENFMPTALRFYRE